MTEQEVVFGFGAHSGISEAPGLLRTAQQADRDGLDLFSLSDHPYLGDRLDAYASIGFVLGRTQRIAGFANVTNLPTRAAARARSARSSTCPGSSPTGRWPPPVTATDAGSARKPSGLRWLSLVDGRADEICVALGQAVGLPAVADGRQAARVE